MTKGQQLLQDVDILGKKRIQLQKAADHLKVVMEFNYTPLLKSALEELIKDQQSFDLTMSVVQNALKEYQNVCSHEKESFIGSNHNFDIYKCNECGKEREE